MTIEEHRLLVERSIKYWQRKFEEYKYYLDQADFNLDFLSWYHRLLHDEQTLQALEQYPNYHEFYAKQETKKPDYIPIGTKFTDSNLHGYPLSVIQQYYKDSNEDDRPTDRRSH